MGAFSEPMALAALVTGLVNVLIFALGARTKAAQAKRDAIGGVEGRRLRADRDMYDRLTVQIHDCDDRCTKLEARVNSCLTDILRVDDMVGDLITMLGANAGTMEDRVQLAHRIRSRVRDARGNLAAGG